MLIFVKLGIAILIRKCLAIFPHTVSLDEWFVMNSAIGNCKVANDT